MFQKLYTIKAPDMRSEIHLDTEYKFRSIRNRVQQTIQAIFKWFSLYAVIVPPLKTIYNF